MNGVFTRESPVRKKTGKEMKKECFPARMPNDEASPYFVSKTENEIFVSFVKSRFWFWKRSKDRDFELTDVQNEN